jgi:hypothetical protein
MTWLKSVRSTIAIAVIFSAFALPSSTSFGQDFLPEKFTREQTIEYERQLNALLKTTREEEKQFVAAVILQIRAGKLPSKLVSTSYHWIQKKRPGTNYPFIYFERVLRLQAKAIRLEKEVPPFDFAVYAADGIQLGGPQAVRNVATETEAPRQSFLFGGNRRAIGSAQLGGGQSLQGAATERQSPLQIFSFGSTRR